MSRTQIRHTLLLCLAILAVLCATASRASASSFSVLDLGTLGGTDSTPAAINSSGQVAGTSYRAGDVGSNAYRSVANQAINPLTDDLGPSNRYSSAAGINISGQVVGFASFPSGVHAFRTAPNSPINPVTDDLGSLRGPGNIDTTGQTVSVAFGINASGQAVGESFLPNGFQHAFRTAPNRPINPATDDLGTFGGSYSAAYGINDLSQVVGNSDLPNNLASHAFRTAPNRPINPATDDLGTLSGTFSLGRAINSSGQVVGYSNLASSATGNVIDHAFRTGPNRPINPATDDLGTLGGQNSEALAINASGLVVGNSDVLGTSSLSQHAFLDSAGKMINLNSFLPPNFDFVLTSAPGINDAGQIVAIGTSPTVLTNHHTPIIQHAFLLTPTDGGSEVPEPTTLVVLLAGMPLLAAAAARRRRQQVPVQPLRSRPSSGEPRPRVALR